MRILVVTATYAPSTNGIAISLFQQKSELENRGHQVIVIAPHHPKEIPEKDVIRIPSLPNPFASDYPIPIPLVVISKFVLDVSKTDVVYFHHPFYIGHVALNFAKSMKVPSIFFYHTQYRKYAMNYIPNLALFSAIPNMISKHVNSVINRSSAVIVETRSIASELMGQGITKNINVIPTGRKFPNQTQEPKEKLKIRYLVPQGKIIVLTVARLSKEKNIISLLRVFGRLKNSAQAVLVITGDGPERKKLENFCKEKNIKDVIFTGNVPFTKIQELYQLADIFAYPSVTDTQAVVLSEAMNFGLSLIGYSAPGPIDFINHGENGYIAQNESDFSSLLDQLISNQELRIKMGAKSYEDSKKYTLENSVNILEKLLQDLVSKNLH